MDPGFVRVAAVADVPEGRGLRVEVGDLAIGLFRVGDEIHAMEDVCPHAGGSLSAGTLRGHVVFCPLHFWDFDVRTGFKPGDPDGYPVPCFPVQLEAGEVFVLPVEKRRSRSR